MRLCESSLLPAEVSDPFQDLRITKLPETLNSRSQGEEVFGCRVQCLSAGTKTNPPYPPSETITRKRISTLRTDLGLKHLWSCLG